MTKFSDTLMIGMLFVMIAFMITMGPALVMYSLSLSDQLDIFEWDHDMTSIDEEIKKEFKEKKSKSLFYEILGFAFFGIGMGLILTLWTSFRLKRNH